MIPKSGDVAKSGESVTEEDKSPVYLSVYTQTHFASI